MNLASDLDDRRRGSLRGAQYSNTQGAWIGWLWDGRYTTVFEPRTTRERALQDAHDHYDRMFNEERPYRRWEPKT